MEERDGGWRIGFSLSSFLVLIKLVIGSTIWIRFGSNWFVRLCATLVRLAMNHMLWISPGEHNDSLPATRS